MACAHHALPHASACDALRSVVVDEQGRGRWDAVWVALQNQLQVGLCAVLVLAPLHLCADSHHVYLS